MARRGKQQRAGPIHGKRRGRLFVAFERALLGFGMSVMAWFIERRLVKAIQKGGLTAAPRTAAEREEAGLGVPSREGELATSPHQVGDQAHG